MEFIHSLSDGKKAVIYDDGNNVMLLFITNIRNMQSAVVVRDYLSLLDCLYFRNNICLGENLIVTSDRPNGSLNSYTIGRIVELLMKA